MKICVRYLCGNVRFIGILLLIVISSSSVLANEARDRALRFPVKAYNNGRHEMAIEGFKEFLNEYPNDTAVFKVKKWLAYSYKNTDRPDDAFKRFREVFKQAPSAEVFNHLAKLGQELNKIDSLIPLLDRDVLTEFPSLQRYLIAWNVKRGKIEETKELLRKIPNVNYSERTKKFLGETKLRQVLIRHRKSITNGSWPEDAEADFQRAGTDTSSIQIWVQKGAETLWDEERYDALISFIDSVPEYWKNLETKLFVAESLVKLIQRKHDDESTQDQKSSRLQRAADIYSELTSKRDFQFEAKYGLAWVQFEMDKHDKSIDALSQSQAPNSEELRAEMNLLRARNYRAQSDWEKAVNYYEKALDILSDKKQIPKIRLELARSYFEADRSEDAREVVDAVDPGTLKTPVYYYELKAELELAEYNNEPAIEALRNAIDSSQNDRKRANLKYRLGKAYFATGNDEEAFQVFDSIYQNDPPDEIRHPLLLAMLRSMVYLERFEQAKKLVESEGSALRSKYPAQYFYFTGVAFFETGNYEQARSKFTELINSYENSQYNNAARSYKFKAALEVAKNGVLEDEDELKKVIEPLPENTRKQLKWNWANKSYQTGSYEQARTLYTELVESELRLAKKVQGVVRLLDIARRVDDNEAVQDLYAQNQDVLFDHQDGARGVYLALNTAYDAERDEFVKRVAKRYLDEFSSPPNKRDITFMLAESMRLTGETNSALKHYRRVIELSDENDTKKKRAKYRVGLLSFKKDKHEEVLNLLKSFRLKPPEFANRGLVLSVLSESYQKENQPKKSLEVLKEARSLEQSPVSALEFKANKLFLEGLIALKNEKPDVAKKKWYEITFKYSDWAKLDQVLYYLHDLLKKQENPDEAKKILNRLKSNFPESPYLEQIE